jgi:hypothetical protein
MKYTFENSEKCDRCGYISSEKCGLTFGGVENVYCFLCKDFKVNGVSNTELEMYYTPRATEFHIGFEYEEFCVEWLNGLFEFYDTFEALEHKLFKELIRVKYLDSADILSLGFSNSQEDISFGLQNVKFSIDYIDSCSHKIKVNLLYQPIGNRILLSRGYYKQGIIEETDELDFKTMFFGKIKNKSDLKVLLKQLEIFK